MTTSSDSPSLENPPEAIPVADAVSLLKLPPFWPSDPLVWFAQIESQFINRNITHRYYTFQGIGV